MKIKFCGAAQTVTGSNHLITTNSGLNILLDCGLFQGKQAYIDQLNANFLFDPKQIDYLILSHAHIDHCGRIPLLVKLGFKGKIFCTPATKDLCEIMLLDTAYIQEKDNEWHNKRRIRRGEEPVPPLYTVKDAERCMKFFVSADYETIHQINEEVSFQFRDAGHILGSASVVVFINDRGKETRIGFTGDIGRWQRPILKDPEVMQDVDYLITESTYGGKSHQKEPDNERELTDLIEQVCIKQGGKIIIPAFSLGRTQEIVYELDKIYHQQKFPRIKVFVDSPLSTNATEIYRNHGECFYQEILTHLKSDPDPFGFGALTYIQDVNESKQLNILREPCIIISASGMAEAGRVVHHIRNNIENERNAILFVGFCAEGTLGSRIRNKPEYVKIFGEEKKIRARIEIMDSFSAHADHDEILQFLKPLNKNKIKKVFLVHGETNAQQALRTAMLAEGYKNINIPEYGESFAIDN
jgi:metallo-beta-lactamase family protein